MSTRLHQATEIELLSHLYRSLPTSVIGIMVNAAIITFVMWSVSSSWVLLAWFAAILLVNTFRFLLFRRFKQTTLTHDNVGVWKRRAVIGSLVTASLWSAAGWFFFQTEAQQHQLILMIVLAGICAGSAILLSAHKYLAIGYVAIILLPLSIRFFLEGSTVYGFTGGMVLLFLYVNISGIKQNYSKLFENVRLKLESKENEEILKQNEAFLNDTGKITQIGGWNFDIRNGKFAWTQQVYDIFELPPDTSASYRRTLQMFGQDTHELASHFNHLMTTGESFTLDVKVTVLSGKQKWIRVIGNADMSETPVARIFGSFQDISTQKDVEERLHHVSEMAIAATKAKSEFLANMSHEIRTPLHGILGALEILKKQAESEQQLAMTATAEKSAQNLLSIINDILDLSKIESGNLRLESQRFDIRKSLETSCQLFIHDVHKKNLQLQCFYPVSAPRFLFGDELRLQQVINNLLANAIKFTERGVVRIKATCEKTSTDHCNLLVEVSDTGIGIPIEYQKNLFTAFTQADGSMARKFGGTGLGLSICKSILEAMQGSIEVESMVGVGTTFRFHVPLIISADITAEPVAHYKRRLLLISKDQFLCEMLNDYAASFSAQLECCETATQEQITQADIILLDWDSEADAAAFEKRANGKKLHHLNRAGNGTAEDTVHGPILLGDMGKWLKESVEPEQQTIPPEQPAPQYSGRVLLVEDNEINQMISGEMLRQAGLYVEISKNGLMAIDILQNHQFDLILMDCQMPEMDGYEATRQIRAQEAKEHAVPRTIIALTANVMPSDRDKCTAAGMNDFLGKPFSFEQVHAVLDKWLRPVTVSDKKPPNKATSAG